MMMTSWKWKERSGWAELVVPDELNCPHGVESRERGCLTQPCRRRGVAKDEQSQEKWPLRIFSRRHCGKWWSPVTLYQDATAYMLTLYSQYKGA